jgi:hypothetical protein
MARTGACNKNLTKITRCRAFTVALATNLVPRHRGFDRLACLQGWERVTRLMHRGPVNTPAIIRPQHREGRISAQMKEGDAR